MSDNKTTPKEVTKIVTKDSTINIQVPAGAQINSASRHKKYVDLVTPDVFVGGFVSFLREHAIVGLAVGFAIGAQAQLLVKTLVSSFIDPMFALFFGQQLSKQTFTLQFATHAPVDFGWGAFVYGLLNFMIVLASIYVIIRLFKLDGFDKPKEDKK